MLEIKYDNNTTSGGADNENNLEDNTEHNYIIERYISDKYLPVATPLHYKNHVIEIVLMTNRDIQIARPIQDIDSPELNTDVAICEIYQYCIFIPIVLLIITISIYYIVIYFR